MTSCPFSSMPASQFTELLNWVSDTHHTEMIIDHYTAPLDYCMRMIERVRAPGGLGSAISV